ncbi:MAG TPA: signal peptidase II [Acidimicrobiales bacterium]|nr:signal peptidase II [Acidimicrobiales bacterium]
MVLALAISSVGCDRVTKRLATDWLAGEPPRSYLGDTLRLTYAQNTGGFLSLGENLPDVVRMAVFTVATAAVLVALVVLAVRGMASGVRLAGIAFFVAGGASNWLDRALRGSVVDFLNVGVGPIRTGVFNVADMAIMLGAALFVVAEIADRRRRTESAQ